MSLIIQMAFNNNTISLTLIQKAQQGCKESMSALIECIKNDIKAYLFRLTLDSHLTEDLYQETLMEMVKHLHELKFTCVKAFWGWLYKIAHSKVCRQSRKKYATENFEVLNKIPAGFAETPPHNLIKQELTQAIYDAISSLKVNYRNVITLRCFQQLSYAEIAGITGSTQMQAKLRFFRAKQALKRQLKKRGFKKSNLLPGLGLFATLTHKSAKAGMTSNIVSASSMKVGMATTILGTAVSKVGLVAVSVVTIALSSTVVNNQISSFTSKPTGLSVNIIKDSDYAYPIALSQVSNPDGKDWQRVVFEKRGNRIESTDPEDVLVPDQFSPGICLILPVDRWIQVEFAKPLLDDPGVDLFLSGYGLTNKPLVSLVGSNNELIELVPTLTLDQPTGYTVIAFDLADVDLSSRPSQVRVTAVSPEAGNNPFELQMVRARLKDGA